MNKFVSLVPPLFLFDEKAIFFPLFENTGNASKESLKVILSRFFPSISIMYRLKGKPKTASKLDENITFLPEGWKTDSNSHYLKK